MPTQLQFDPSRETASFSDDLRGDLELDVPALIDGDDVVSILDREHLGTLIQGFGLVEREGPFPESFTDIRQIAAGKPGQVFELYELVTGQLIGLNQNWLETVIRSLAGNDGFDPADFTLYHPSGTTGDIAPFALASTHTPLRWVTDRLFGGQDAFAAEFGANACPECQQKFTEPFIGCPDCGYRPESVQENIDLIREEHDGVVALIAPLTDFGPTTDHQIQEGTVDVRQPLEHPDPEVDVIESPGVN